MDDVGLKSKVINGFKWKTIERACVQLMNALVPIVLARILGPDAFGTVALLAVFVTISNTLVNNGLCNALIQRQDVGSKEESTVFYTQLLIAVICYIILFFLAPFIARFYDNMTLTPMLRVMSVTVLISAFTGMQTMALKKKMVFYKSFMATTIATVVYGIVGIALALKGLGPWSLVIANISNQLSMMIVYIIVVRWRPTMEFSFSALKGLFGYSYKLFVGWMIGTLHQELYSLVIGKRFSSAILGFYNRAMSIPQIIGKTISEVYDGVMFPAMSKIHDDKAKMRDITKKMLTVNSFVLFPVYMGISAVSKNLIIILLTDKWLPAAHMMMIMSFTFAFNSLNNSNMQIFNSMGRSDIFMKFELIKRSISMVMLIIMSLVSIYAVIFLLLAMALMSNGMNIYQNKKLLQISFKEQFSCICPSLFSGLLMFVVALLVGQIALNVFISIVLQVFTGALAYLIISIVFKLKGFQMLIDLGKPYLKRFAH